ncbi:MAG: hypothetical protein LQ351_002654 [Letrouitia transgressa]|nr:MAG: hypothetical protein LQ351_002654 [Letrouitia transgressa]
MGLEVPRLDQRLRIHSTSLSNDMQRQLTRRTGWTLTWDVKRSLIEVQEGEGRETWIEQVGELSRNVREIIAAGGLEAWVKAEIGKAAAANTKVTKCPETPRHSKQDDKIYREQNSGSGLQDALILECGSFIKAYKRGSVGDNLCLGRATKN